MKIATQINFHDSTCRINVRIALVLFIGIMNLFNSVRAQGFSEAQILKSEGGLPDERFGQTVAVSGEYAIVGASSGGTSQGKAYIFKKDSFGNWKQHQILVAGFHFGNNSAPIVAIDGDYAAIGTNLSESIYIFKKDNSGNWNFLQGIWASDNGRMISVGQSISISGDYLVTGPKPGFTDESVFIFKKNSNGTWDQFQKLIHNGSSQYSSFGSKVSIHFPTP